MKVITAYEVGGKVFTDLKEAQKAEKSERIEIAVTVLIDNTCWNGMAKHDVFEFVMENSGALKAALK